MFVMNRDMDDLLKEFHLPFGGKLNPDNRWVQLVKIIPWDSVEEQYVQAFQSPVEGQRAYPVRVALGALIIKERLGLSEYFVLIEPRGSHSPERWLNLRRSIQVK